MDSLSPEATLERATERLAAGDLDEAARLCAAGGEDPRLLRVAAYVHQQQGRPQQAAAAYETVLRAFPGDWESLNNFGNALMALDRFDEAVAVFQRAIQLRPDWQEMVFNLSEALRRAERHDERQAVMRTCASIDGDDPRVLTELGLAEWAADDLAAAERAFRAAIRLAPASPAAWLELGLLLETLNRTDELTALAGEADTAGLGAEAHFLKAWALRRQDRYEEALVEAEAVPATISPLRRHELLAGLYDRLGRPAEAFTEFEAMNRTSELLTPPPPGPSYREEIEAAAARTTPEWVAGWTRFEVMPEPPAPIFILGFPRSGTTLLDTLLMNIPTLHVLEEQPLLRFVEGAIAPDGDLGLMSAEEAHGIRAYYYQLLADLSPLPPGRQVVDKHPLHMARMPLIQRVFPEAKIIFVERHPCDAVLSCFMANFTLNPAMRSFTRLEEAARTYDALFDAWARAEDLLPLHVHRVRYERMIEDLAGEMRPLLDFLGLPWDEKVLDNQAAARARGRVITASYSQVGEPIYTRAAGRWERYREQLAPVLPILAPWAERMGYEMGGA
ncbi:MAG TPA: sulfotransferase [Allosphingosinicella sp.]|nr:sulfotransferase [Allosphingosinicella sp.]